MQFMTMAHLLTSGVLIALVILLICIVVQQRESNRIRREEITLRLRSQFMELQNTLAANEDLANLYQRGLRGFTGLSDTEQTRFFIISSYTFTYWSEVQRYAKSGLVSQAYWDEVQKQFRDYVQYPGVQQFWQYRKHWYPQDTQRVVDSLIENAPEQPNPLYPEPVV